MESDPTWGLPVTVRIGNGGPEFIHNPLEALDYLSARWPLMDGPHLSNAKRQCRDATENGGSNQVAREAFIAAAIEADVLQ